MEHVKKPRVACLNIAVLSVLFVLSAGPMSNTQGAVIESRTELLSQLGANAVTEDFESYVFPDYSSQRVGTNVDAGSVIDGQGPGLVKSGVRFIQQPPGEGLQWDRQFDYLTTSAAMVSDDKLIVDFTIPVSHAGLDLFWFNYGVHPSHPSTIQVFAADDVTLLFSTNIFEPLAPDSYFFGYTDSQKIGRIVLFRDEGGELGVSPMIDNLTFGLVQAATAPLLSIALNGQQVMLSWPQTVTGYQLETALTVQASWTDITNTPISLGDQYSVTLPATNFCSFFRLHKPAN